jgi:hypothetical protein
MLREHLPERIAALVPKGDHNCGDHEWYKSCEQTWRCYHCKVGVTHSVPWNALEIEARQHEATSVLLRAGLRQPSHATLHDTHDSPLNG